MILYIFGNGNLSYQDFHTFYVGQLQRVQDLNPSYILGDFRGADTMAMEYLKTASRNVRIFHMGARPRYYPDAYCTLVGKWKKVGWFKSDESRDDAAIESCTHYLAVDFNSDENRKNGTRRNIELCNSFGKIRL